MGAKMYREEAMEKSSAYSTNQRKNMEELMPTKKQVGNRPGQLLSGPQIHDSVKIESPPPPCCSGHRFFSDIFTPEMALSAGLEV